MPLRRNNTTTFHRKLYAGELETVILLKRENDQRQGIVKKHTLFDCRWGMIFRSGEPIQGDLDIGASRALHIPRIEMDRIGVWYFNALDRFIDAENRWWEPEARNRITHKLFQNHVCVDCVRIDPPANVIGRVVG